MLVRANQELIPPATSISEAMIREPGTFFDGLAQINFDDPNGEAFLIRHEPLDLFATAASQAIEVHQPHPRGVSWATLEFPILELTAGSVIQFGARLLPNEPVTMKLYTATSDIDIDTMHVNYKANRFQASISREIAEIAAREERLHLGFTLPGGTWFVFQICDLVIQGGAE
jgi:hypothetical protein